MATPVMTAVRLVQKFAIEGSFIRLFVGSDVVLWWWDVSRQRGTPNRDGKEIMLYRKAQGLIQDDVLTVCMRFEGNSSNNPRFCLRN